MNSFNEHVEHLLMERASIVQSILRGEVVAQQIITAIKNGKLDLFNNEMDIKLKGYKGKEPVSDLTLKVILKSFNNTRDKPGAWAYFKATNQLRPNKEGIIEIYLFEIFGHEMNKNYRGYDKKTLNDILKKFVDNSNTNELISVIQHELLHANSFRRELRKYLIVTDEEGIQWSLTNVSHLTTKHLDKDAKSEDYYNLPDEIMAYITGIVSPINNLWLKQLHSGTILKRNNTESINRQIDFAIKGFGGYSYLTDDNKKKFRQKMYSTVMGLWEKYKKVAEDQQKT